MSTLYKHAVAHVGDAQAAHVPTIQTRVMPLAELMDDERNRGETPDEKTNENTLMMHSLTAPVPSATLLPNAGNGDFRSTIGLISTDEMSGILFVSKETLATWRSKRRGPPAIKVGRRTFYPLVLFNAWLAAQGAAKPKTKPA